MRASFAEKVIPAASHFLKKCSTSVSLLLALSITKAVIYKASVHGLKALNWTYTSNETISVKCFPDCLRHIRSRMFSNELPEVD
jgi:hypothetical protein